MAHQIIQRETRQGMRLFRIVYRDLNTGEVLSCQDEWADSVNEVYRETLKRECAGVISEYVTDKWVERLGFTNPGVK